MSQATVSEEVHPIPSSARGPMLRKEDAIVLQNTASGGVTVLGADAAETAASVIAKALEDVSSVSGGIAIEVVNNSGLDLALVNTHWWSMNEQQLGSFGTDVPPVRIKSGGIVAYDINYSIPLAEGPFLPIRVGGALSMVYYRSAAFDLLLGVRFWYTQLVGGAMWWPYVLAQLGSVGQYSSMSSDGLYSVLKDNSVKQLMTSSLGEFTARAECGMPGLHSHALTVTVYKPS